MGKKLLEDTLPGDMFQLGPDDFGWVELPAVDGNTGKCMECKKLVDGDGQCECVERQGWIPRRVTDEEPDPT